MSKRFVDTGIFDDDWFMDLPKDAKVLWLYFITKCDHAGILKLNEKLCKVQTDIKDLHGVIKQLGNRLITVSEHLYFIPKFIEFQYPGFPNSKVRQQQSALEILKKYGLYSDEGLRVIKELDNTYENEHDNDNGIEGGMGDSKKWTPEEVAYNFYVNEGTKAKEYSDEMSKDYVLFCYHICQKKDNEFRLPNVLKMKNQISLNEFSKLYAKAGGDLKEIISKVDSLQTNIKYHGKYTDLYLTINNWLK